MSLSPFEHPLLSGLFGDDEIISLFSAKAEIEAVIAFERALAEAQADAGVISPDASKGIVAGLIGFTPDLTLLRNAVARDGLVVPELVRQMRETIGKAHADKLHFGATSQDAIDTGLMLRLKQAVTIIISRLRTVVGMLDELLARDGDNQLTAYTRMQPAIPIIAADRVENWIEPLKRHADKFQTFAWENLVIQFGGAAGTLEKLGDSAAEVRAGLAARLHLSDRPQWHNQRDGIAELAGLLSLVTGSLGKIGQDIALLAEIGGEIRLSGGGGSSAMPHKQNPINAEALVTLARFNAVQVSALHHSLVHEQERSGASWMLEWMSLPQMVAATGASLLIAQRLVAQIDRLGVTAELSPPRTQA